MQITWYGTAAVAIQTENSSVLSDPFVPWKGSTAPIRIDDYDGFSDILVTHGHFDHIETLPEILKRNPKAKIYCTKTPYRTLAGQGVPKESLKGIAPGKQFMVGDMLIRVHQGRHANLQINWKDRLMDKRLLEYWYNVPHALLAKPMYPENGETLIYEILAGKKTLVMLGSMNLPKEGGPESCDVLLLPYAGYLDNYSAALRIIDRFSPKKVILTHFDDTFPPLTRPQDLSKIRAFRECEVIIPEYKKAITIE